MKNYKIVSLFLVTGALVTGCAVEVGTPTVSVAVPEPVVTVGVPDSYVWDGVEFVGLVGGQYMYLGPGGGWLVCDSYRLDRFHGYERGHPDWRRSAVRNSGSNARGRAPARKEEKRDERR